MVGILSTSYMKKIRNMIMSILVEACKKLLFLYKRAGFFVL